MAAVSIGAKYPNVYEYIADTEDDIESLPTTVGKGSTCLVIATGAVYILSPSGEWAKLGGDD